ncbi:S24 family peptidase [Lachnospiraceae bacterium 46-61]
MFQKNLFREQLIKLMNGKTTTEFSEQTGFNRTYLSKYLNLKLDRPPSPRLLQAIASNIVPYEELLISCGYIQSENLPKNNTIVKLPIIGSVHAGNPTFSEDYIEGYESIDISELNTCYDYIYIRVEGNSMINARIHDGDIVLVRKQSDVENGDIAVVVIDNESATLKRILKKENILVLQPENPAYSSYIFSGEEQNRVRVIGKVMHVKFVPV